MAGGLDHLVIVARDIDAQAELYRRLGFQVGARNRHNWGTLNNIVQFDGVFLELLTTEPEFQRPPADSAVSQFTDPIIDYLAAREGLAMMVLEGFDTDVDHANFNAAGIGMPETFYFARQGRRPDGEPVEVAFSLAFAQSPEIRQAGFFVCQQHAPEMFWNPAFQVHENGAAGVSRVVFAAPEPACHRVFFEAYTGVMAAETSNAGLRLTLPRGAIDVVTPETAANTYGRDALPAPLEQPRFVAIEFAVEDDRRVADVLTSNGVTFQQINDRVIVPASAAMGVTLAFSRQ
jgi:catechol 2,3-dioxygenase-like lactoylglutathione lyase family enzyme